MGGCGVVSRVLFVSWRGGLLWRACVLILVLFGVQEGIDDSWESDYAVSISVFNFGKGLRRTAGVLVEIGDCVVFVNVIR